MPRAVLVDLEPGTMDSVRAGMDLRRLHMIFLQVLSARSLDLTTSSLDSLVPETTGLRDTTPRALS